jgi:hypothetical protein
MHNIGRLSDGGVQNQLTQFQQNETHICNRSQESVFLRTLLENSLHFGAEHLPMPLRVQME